MNFSEWEKKLPAEILNDSLWKMEAYRLSLFLNDIGWKDVTKLMQDRRTVSLSDQLYRALGSICANLEEGYSKNSNRDRARFYEYALASARESRGWYYRARFVLGGVVTRHRLSLLTGVIKLLLTMVPQQRSLKVKEAYPHYDASALSSMQIDMKNLLNNIPLPEKSLEN